MGLHIITSNGDLRKQIHSHHYGQSCDRDKHYGSNFYPGEKFTTLKSFSNEETRGNGKLFHRILTSKRKNIALIPNIGEGENWIRIKENLGDQKRNWYQVDNDDWVEEASDTYTNPWETDTRSLALLVLRASGFPNPEELEFVAQRSSTAKIEYCPKIRIYLFLNEELNERELTCRFQGLVPEGATMAQRERLHIIKDPLILDDGVVLHKTAGEDVVHQKGKLLDVSKLPWCETPKRREFTKGGDKYSVKGKEFIDKVLSDFFGGKHKIPRNDVPQIFLALRNHSKKHPQQWNGNRNYSSGYILRESYLRTQSFEEGRKLILENEAIRGDLSERQLDAKQQSILRRLTYRWKLGDITQKFKDESSTIKKVFSFDLGVDITKEEIEALPDEFILLLYGAEGTGKSEFIKKVIEVKKPNSILGVAHKKAVVKPMCELYGLEDYEELKGSLPLQSIAENKREMMPKTDYLGCVVNSLHYVLEEGERLSFIPREMVIYDEGEHTIEKLRLSTDGIQGVGFDEENEVYFDSYTLKSRTARAYTEAAAHAKMVIIADAKASEELVGNFIDEIHRDPKKQKILLLNEADWIAKMSCDFYKSAASLLVQAKECIERGQNIVFQTDFANGKGDNRPRQAALVHALRDYCDLSQIEVVPFNAKSFTNDREITIQNAANKMVPLLLEGGARIIVNSPWNTEGWSYKGDGIHATFNLYEFKFIHAEDIKQGFRRWRKTLHHHFYIKQNASFGMSDVVGKSALELTP